MPPESTRPGPPPPGGLGGTSLVAGTGRSFRGTDAGSPRIDFIYGGDPSFCERGCVGASGAPPAAQPMFRQALGARADDLGDEPRDLGRVRADADAVGLERLLLRLRRSRRSRR